MAFLTLFAIPSEMFAKEKSDNALNYEIEGAGTATQGYYMVSITVLSKKKNVDDEMLRRAAVHGVLFRGFSNPSLRQTQKPLAGSGANEAAHADFYKEFFGEGGTAATYASLVPGTRSITKSGKIYRVTATATVNKETLLEYLQDAGMVRGLNSAF